MKQISVAIRYDDKGNVIGLYKNMIVNEIEYKRLENDYLTQKNIEQTRLVKLERKVRLLELEIKLDRGEITKEEYDKEIGQ